MADLLIEVETDRGSLGEIRGDVDVALARHFPVDLLESRWEGDVLHITGPGAEGTMVFDAGTLRVQATLKPPASLLRTVIEHKIRAALAEAFDEPPVGNAPPG